MSDQFFGWELLFNNVKNDIKKKEDVLILLIHFSLIRAGFKCVGVDDEWKTDERELSSELLPKEWNANKEYVFRYKHNDEKFVLRSCHSDSNTIIFNFMQTAKLKVSNVMFNYEDSVKALEGNISAMLPDHKDLVEAIQRDLITSFVTPEKKNADTQTTSDESTKSTRVDPLLVRDCRPLRNIEPYGIPDINNIGRRDLDPLAAMGRNDPFNPGGMIFDPFEDNRRLLQGGPAPGPGVPRRLPRGAVPPGSRFDPFGPPDRNLNPGPDRFPPEYDDMFS